MRKIRHREGGRSGDELAGESVMESADLGEGYHIAHLGRLDWTRIRAIVVQRPVGSQCVVVGRVASKNPQEVPLIEDDDVVEALSANRSVQSLTIRILPRRTGCRDDFFDAHRPDAPDEIRAEDTVSVTKEISGRCIVGRGFAHLLGSPTGRKRGSDIGVQNATPVVGHDQENVEDAERRRWNHEEVDCDDVPDVVVQERPPALGGGLP